jgi:acetyl esterase/lipase
MTTQPGPRLLLAVAALLFFLSLWVLLPPPTYPLLVLAVGAPELSPWLIVVALAVAIPAVGRAAHYRIARRTVILAGAAAVLAAIPLLRFSGSAARFDGAMRHVLGEQYLCAVPAKVRRAMRPHPLDPIELFRGLRPAGARITRGVTYAENDGVSLKMDVYRPVAAGNHPAVIQIYGGAWQRGAPRDNAAFASYLAAHGYVVFAIDYRHAPRWRWPAQLADVRAALAWIGRHAAEYDADAGRLALLGRSSGAQLAMVAAYSSDVSPVRAVVSYYGPVDLVEGYRHPPRPDPLDVRRIEEAFLGGHPDDIGKRYREASPITYAVRPQPPTLLVYAGRDHVVEPRFGFMLRERLRANGTKAVLLEIPWAEHGFDAVTGGPSAQLALYHTERFLAWAFLSSDPAACARDLRDRHQPQ